MDHYHDTELRGYFLDEAEALLQQLQTAIAELEYGDEAERTVEDIHRGFHTLKGGAAQMAGCEPMADCALLAEKLAKGMREKLLAVNPGLISLLNQAAEAILGLIATARHSPQMPDYSEALRQRLSFARQKLLDIESRALSGDGSVVKPVSIDNELLDFFFAGGSDSSASDKGKGGAAGGERPAGAEPEAMSDDEFEGLLDEMYGRGRGPSSGAARESAGADQSEQQQLALLVAELQWVREKIARLRKGGSEKDLDKAFAYLDFVIQDFQRFLK